MSVRPLNFGAYPLADSTPTTVSAPTTPTVANITAFKGAEPDSFTPSQPPQEKEGMSTGAKVGIGAVVVGLAGAALWFFTRKKVDPKAAEKLEQAVEGAANEGAKAIEGAAGVFKPSKQASVLLNKIKKLDGQNLTDEGLRKQLLVLFKMKHPEKTAEEYAAHEKQLAGLKNRKNLDKMLVSYKTSTEKSIADAKAAHDSARQAELDKKIDTLFSDYGLKPIKNYRRDQNGYVELERAYLKSEAKRLGAPDVLQAYPTSKTPKKLGATDESQAAPTSNKSHFATQVDEQIAANKKAMEKRTKVTAENGIASGKLKGGQSYQIFVKPDNTIGKIVVGNPGVTKTAITGDGIGKFLNDNNLLVLVSETAKA